MNRRSYTDAQVEALAARVGILEARASRLEEEMRDAVTHSQFPRLQSQIDMEQELSKINKSRDNLKTMGRYVVQALIVAALAGMFGVAWQWWTGPKEQNPPIVDKGQR